MAANSKEVRLNFLLNNWDCLTRQKATVEEKFLRVIRVNHLERLYRYGRENKRFLKKNR